MKRTAFVLLSALWVVGCSAPDRVEAEPLFRHHFIGGLDLAKQTNSAKLKSVWELPESRAFVGQLKDKLATTPFRALAGALPEGAKDHAELIRPLIDDLWNFEACSEVRGPVDGVEVMVAVRVDDQGAARWGRMNLWQVVSAWGLGEPRLIKVGQYEGWEAKSGRRLIQFFNADGWVVLGSGSGPLNLAPRALGKLAQGKKPVETVAGRWASVSADLRWMTGKLPWAARLPLGPIEFSIRGEGENLKTTGKLTLDKPLPKKLETWMIPTNSIMDNISSFTVARGLKTLLGTLDVWKALNVSEVPGQVVVWGPTVRHSGYLYAATPVPDPTNEVRRIAPMLPKLLTDALQPKMGKFAYASNAASLSFVGLPYVMPHIKTLEQDGRSYLAFGMFPSPPITTQPPKELLSQFQGSDDIVYYDWEITEHRLFHSRQTYQLLDIARGLGFSPKSAASQTWVTKVAPMLGNTITEAVATSPTELSFSRRSHLGLTGIEIYSVVDWVESPGFPLTWERRPPLKLLSPEQIEEIRQQRLKEAKETPPGATPNPAPGAPPKKP